MKRMQALHIRVARVQQPADFTDVQLRHRYEAVLFGLTPELPVALVDALLQIL